MFNRMYSRIMAVAALVGLASSAAPIVRTPHRGFTPVPPPTPRLDPPRTLNRPTPRRASSWDVWKRPRQEGELARRRRQIERGQLNICNGLVVPGLCYLGHGRALHLESNREVAVP